MTILRDHVSIHGVGRGMLELGPSEIREAILRLAAKSEQRDGCWHWLGYTQHGYPSISIHDSDVRGHRLSFMAFKGPLKPGHEVCHTCDNRRCWNPAHLFGGTHLENVRDAVAKGRASKPPVLTGEAHPKATLSDEDVARIRAADGVPQRELAAAFGCSQSTIWRLRHRQVRSNA